MIMEWLRKAPTAVVVTVIIVCGIIALGVLGAFVWLSVAGVDTTDLRQWVQTLGILIFGPLIGVNTVTGLVSARASSRAEDNTNGHLTARDAQIAAQQKQINALTQRLSDRP